MTTMTPAQAWDEYVGEITVEQFLGHPSAAGMSPRQAVESHLTNLDEAPNGDERETVVGLLLTHIEEARS